MLSIDKNYTKEFGFNFHTIFICWTRVGYQAKALERAFRNKTYRVGPDPFAESGPIPGTISAISVVLHVPARLQWPPGYGYSPRRRLHRPSPGQLHCPLPRPVSLLFHAFRGSLPGYGARDCPTGYLLRCLQPNHRPSGLWGWLRLPASIRCTEHSPFRGEVVRGSPR